MADIALTLDLATGGGQAYYSGSIGIAQATPGDGPYGYVDGAFVYYPLSSPSTVMGANGLPALQQGITYAFLEPSGAKAYKTMPASSSANYSDIASTIPVPAAPAVTYTQSQLDTFLGGKADLTPTGREQLATQDYAKLRPLFFALEQRETTPVNIGFMGPSTVEGYLTAWSTTPSQAMQRRLRQRFPISGLGPSQGGTGIIPIPSGPVRGVGATASPTTTPWTFSASMQFDETAFASGVTHTIAYTNGAEYGQITTDRDLTSIKVNHLAGTSGGVAAAYIRADALTAVTFNTNAGAITVKEDSFTAVQLGFPGGIIPTGTVIKVGGMSTGAYLILSHVEGYYNDTTKGIRVHNIGHSGYDTQDWLQTVAGGATMATIAGLSLSHLLLDFFGINAGSTGRSYASGGSRTAAQWKTEMVAFIAALRTAGINCNITLIASYDPTGGIALTSSWAAYVTAMREIATADATVSFYDHSLRMPATGATTTYGYYAADKVHLTATGNAKIAAGIIEYLLQTMDTGPLGDALPGKANLVSGKVPASELDLTATAASVGKKLDVVPWRSGVWYESQFSGFNIANVATTAGTIYYTPITIPQSGVIDQVGISLATVAASSSLQFGLYTDVSGVPAALVRDFGNVATAVGTGAKTVTSLAQSVTAGLYWLAVLPLGGAPTVQFHTSPTSVPAYVGSAAVGDVQRVGYNQTGQASLPSVPSSLATTTSVSRPRVQIKWT